MFEGLQITFSVNHTSYGIGIQNDKYEAYIGIKHNHKKESHRKRLKPYRRPRRCKK